MLSLAMVSARRGRRMSLVGLPQGVLLAVFLLIMAKSSSSAEVPEPILADGRILPHAWTTDDEVVEDGSAHVYPWTEETSPKVMPWRIHASLQRMRRQASAYDPVLIQDDEDFIFKEDGTSHVRREFEVAPVAAPLQENPSLLLRVRRQFNWFNGSDDEDDVGSGMEHENDVGSGMEQPLPTTVNPPRCTEDQFECVNGACVPRVYMCDGVPDCSDGSDEVRCPTNNPDQCTSDQFACSSGECVGLDKRCNEDYECLDGSDEIGCPHGPGCNSDGYQCSNGDCIPSSQRCNGYPECVDQSDESSCQLGECPSTERMLLNTTWHLTKTAIGSTLDISCPRQKGSTLDGTWRCGPEGQWDKTPDLSRCRNIEQLFLAPHSENPSLAVDNLTELANNIEDQILFPGDLLSIMDGLQFLQKQHIDTDIKGEDTASLSERYAKVLFNVTNAVLAQYTWHFMPEKNIREYSTVLQVGIVRAALTEARFVTSDTVKNYAEDNSNINVRLVIMPRDYYTKEENRLYEHATFLGTQLLLPQNFIDNVKVENSEESEERVVVVFNSFSTLHCLTNDVPCKPPSDDDSSEKVNATAQANSGIIGATVGSRNTWHADSNEFVELNFSHIYDGSIYKLENVECKWWNTETHDWSSDGCELKYTNELYSICHCNHLTNLAVIMDIRGLLDRGSFLWKSLQWITVIGCSLSIICLSMSIFCFWALKKAREKKKSSIGAKKYLIRLHLCVCLFLAEIVLLLGLDKTGNKIICTTIAAVLHYFFLATFTWSAIEALNLYLAVMKVFETLISQRHYLLAGYGIPFGLVATTLALSRTDYASDHVCWLAPNSTIWSFAGTIAFIMMINIVAFVMVMRIVWKERSVGNNVRNSPKPKKDKIIGSVAIFFVLGLTWITGFFFLTEGSKPLAVIFTLLNSLQGINILIFGIIFEDEIRKELKNLIMEKLQNLRQQPVQTTHVTFAKNRGATGNSDVTEIGGEERTLSTDTTNQDTP